MQTNLGAIDRTVRISLAIILLSLYFWGIFPATAGIIFLVLAFVLFVTSLVGFCPLYAVFGIRTCKVKKL